MTKYLENKPNIDYTYDKDVVSATYCRSSGSLANSGCSGATGYYVSNNMPGTCNGHYYRPIQEKKQPSLDNDTGESNNESQNFSGETNQRNSQNNSEDSNSQTTYDSQD